MQEKEIQIDPTILKSYIDSVGYKKDNVLDELREVTQKTSDLSYFNNSGDRKSVV